MNELEKIKPEELLRQNNIEIGKYVIDDRGGYFIVDKIDLENNEVDLCYYDKDNEKHHYGNTKIDRIGNDYIQVDNPEQLQKEAIKYILEEQNEEQNEEKVSESTDLMITSSKETLIQLKETTERQRQIIESKRRAIERILSDKKDALRTIVDKFEKQISNINKVLFTIELYFGITEEVLQLKEGKKADINEPITFRQQMMFMDEEVAVDLPEHLIEQGFDFRNIEDFDKWITEKENMNKVIPEEKCMVVLRVRRKDKDYGDIDSILKFRFDEENNRTYLLIRNGENLYRIWADIKFNEMLFPKKEAISNLLKEIEKEFSSYSKEKLENVIFKYKQQIIMMQGLIDRTELFHPLPEQNIKLTDPDAEAKGLVRLIYDGEMLLPSGRKLYKDWKKELNGKLKEGNRIVFKYFWRREDRFLRYYNEGNYPRNPNTGIYTLYKNPKLEEWKERYWKPEFIIAYNPKDEVINYWDYSDCGHERKNNISFLIGRDEDIVLNYDDLTIDDIDWYLYNRVDRANYIDMIIILRRAKMLKIKEKESEKLFVELVKNNTGINEDKIWKAVNWWKLKNKWKRPIDKDDAKAYRMIIKKIKEN